MDPLHKLIHKIREDISLEKGHGSQTMGTWFLGPKGESHELFHDMVNMALDELREYRRSSYPTDPHWANIYSTAYLEESNAMKKAFKDMIVMLRRYSVPFNSYRYQGHMLWDNTLPSMVGYFGAMLHNQNNVAAEASPATTAMEIEVAEDLCRMVGYNTDSNAVLPCSWGHITCDGSVANLEAHWSARNTKFYPFAAYGLLKNNPALASLKGYEIQMGKTGDTRPLLSLDWWELLNIPIPSILKILKDLTDLADQANIDELELQKIDDWSFQNLGWARFLATYDKMLNTKGDLIEAVSKMIVIGPSSAHYSIPKANTILGLGSSGYHKIEVQANARVNIEDLIAKLDQCQKDKIPVMMVVCVMGTTEESAVDYLVETFDHREKLREKNFEFSIHADGAWGGYFASMLREPGSDTHDHDFIEETEELVVHSKTNKRGVGITENDQRFGAAMMKKQLEAKDDTFPAHEKIIIPYQLGLNPHTARQLGAFHKADTITLDPHKSGYAPYPAGSLLYRDIRMSKMIEITAPVVYHGGDAPTVGAKGVEGSKPGAAAASVFFSHQIIRPNKSGYGRILARCNFNAKRMFMKIITMKSDKFEMAALHELSKEQMKTIKKWADLSVSDLLDEILKSEKNAQLFKTLGPDLTIISYAANPIIDGKPNEDLEVTNRFNTTIFKSLTRQTDEDPLPELVITCSEFSGDTSDAPINCLRNQLGLKHNTTIPMQFLITTVMNPWLSDTEGGSRDMVPEIAEIMKTHINKISDTNY